MKTANEKFCSNCGQLIDVRAELCPRCGVRQAYVPPTNMPPYSYNARVEDPTLSEKDWLTTLLLCIFLGYLGIHRFYTGNTLYGVLQLITLGGCGIWTIIDFIFLLTGSYKDGENKFVKNK